MAADKFTAFTRPGIAILQAALPLQHRPAVVVVLGQLAENALKVDLPVAGRTEATGAVDPRLVTTVDAATPAGAELRILHVERFNTRMEDVDKGQVDDEELHISLDGYTHYVKRIPPVEKSCIFHIQSSQFVYTHCICFNMVDL